MSLESNGAGHHADLTHGLDMTVAHVLGVCSGAGACGGEALMRFDWHETKGSSWLIGRSDGWVSARGLWSLCVSGVLPGKREVMTDRRLAHWLTFSLLGRCAILRAASVVLHAQNIPFLHALWQIDDEDL